MIRLFLTIIFAFIVSSVHAQPVTGGATGNNPTNPNAPGNYAQAASDSGNPMRAYNQCAAVRGAADCNHLKPADDPTSTGEGVLQDPGSPGPGGGQTAQERQATTAAAQEALAEFVLPTNTRHFSLSNLSSGNEGALIISNSNTTDNVVYRVIRLIGMLVGTLAVLLYIVAGYFLIFSQGDENQLTKGKQIATYTSLGLALVFTAFMIVQLVLGLMYFSG